MCARLANIESASLNSTPFSFITQANTSPFQFWLYHHTRCMSVRTFIESCFVDVRRRPCPRRWIPLSASTSSIGFPSRTFSTKSSKFSISLFSPFLQNFPSHSSMLATHTRRKPKRHPPAPPPPPSPTFFYRKESPHSPSLPPTKPPKIPFFFPYF